MGTTIDSLEIKIEQSSTNAVSGIDSLTQSIGKLKEASKGGLGLTSVINTIKKIEEPLSNVNSDSLDNFERLSNTLEQLSRLGKLHLSASIATNIERLGQAMNSISPDGLDRFRETVSLLERMSGVTPAPIPNLDSVQTANGTTNDETVNSDQVDDAVQSVNRYEDEVRRASVTTGYLRNQLTLAGTAIKEAYAPVGSKIRESFSSAVNAIRNLGTAIKNTPSTVLTRLATIPLRIGQAAANAAHKFKDLASKIKECASAKIKTNLQKLGKSLSLAGVKASIASSKIGGFVRSLARIAFYRFVRSIISGITKSIKEGIDNFYEFSKVAEGTFAKSMDSIATNANYLKNSLGAMAAPLLNMLAPVIDTLVAKFVSLIEVINQVFARLSGANVFYKAKKQATSYGGAVKSAAKDTKKAAKEIKDATLGIDELHIISPLDEDDDKGSSGGGAGGLNYGDLFEKAEIDPDIAAFIDRVKKLIDNGDWKGLGTLLGNKFNEVFDSIDWTGIGHKIGYAFNGIMQTIYYTLETIDFKNIGKRLSEMFNAALSEIDFNIFGRLMTRGITSVLDTIIGFLTNLDWKQLGKSVGNFVRGVYDEAFEWLTSYKWSDLGKKLYKSLKELIAGVDFATAAQSFFKFFGAALGAAVSFIGSFLAEVVKDIIKYFSDCIEDGGEGFWEIGENILLGVLKGIGLAIINIGKWIYDNVVVPFVDGFKAAFQIHSPSKIMIELGKYIVEGFLKGITDHINDCMEPIKSWSKSVVEWFTKGSDGKGIIEHFKDLANSVVEGFKNKVILVYTSVKSSITTWASSVKSWFSNIVNGTVFSQFANAIVSGFRNTISTTYSTVKQYIETWAKGVKSWFSSIVTEGAFGQYASNIIGGFRNAIHTGYSSVQSYIQTWANAVNTWFSDIASSETFSGFASSVVSAFGGKISETYGSVKATMQSFGNAVKSWFKNPVDGGDDIVTSFRTIGKNLIQGFINGVGDLWNTAMSKIKSFGSGIIENGKTAMGVHSPSVIFKEIGAYVVEGFNLGLESEMGESMKLVKEWLTGLQGYTPSLALAVDSSSLKSFNGYDMARNVAVNANGTMSVVADNMSMALEEFYTQRVQPALDRIVNATETQANKDEKTVVQIGNRAINDAVTTQTNANGFSFTK